MTKQKKVTVEYPVLTDSLGKEVYPGDVLLEYDCGGDGQKYRINLWEIIYPFKGYGINYGLDSEPYKLCWFGLKKSIKVDFDQFAPEFKYSFYHGMSKLYTTIKRGTLKELIDNSDWEDKIVDEYEVDLYLKKKNLRLESIDDIKKNIDLLTGPGATPNLVVEKILDIVKLSPTPMVNGELGYAFLMDSFNYMDVLDKIKQEC